jgi:hypothetical protein
MGTARELVVESGSCLLPCQSRGLHWCRLVKGGAAAQHVPRMELERLEVLGQVRHGGGFVCQ